MCPWRMLEKPRRRIVYENAAKRIGSCQTSLKVDRPKELLSQLDCIIADTDTMLRSASFRLSVELKSPNFRCYVVTILEVLWASMAAVARLAIMHAALLTMSSRRCENGPKIALFQVSLL